MVVRLEARVEELERENKALLASEAHAVQRESQVRQALVSRKQRRVALSAPSLWITLTDS